MKNNTGSTKAIVLILVLIILIVIGYSFSKPASAPSDGVQPAAQITSWSNYSDSQVEFQYPTNFSTKREGDAVVVTHSIVYKHANPCDFKGDAAPLENLTDFSVSFKTSDNSVKETVEAIGDFPGWEYVSSNPFTLGDLKGYRVMAGVEGCGRYEYYLPLSTSKTLVIHESIITELTDIVTDQQTYLSLPGVVTPIQSAEILEKIVSSLKFK